MTERKGKKPLPIVAAPIRARFGHQEDSRGTDTGASRGTDTDVDPSLAKRVRVAAKRPRTGSSRVALPDPPGPVSAGSSGPAPPARGGRLAELQLQEASAKRHAGPIPARAEPLDAEPSRVGERARIGWLRSEDADLRILPYKSHGFVLEGVASGRYAGGSRRAPVVGLTPGSTPAPAVAVGVDGQIFTVRVRSGDTAESTARRLSARLEPRFRVVISSLSSDRILVRLTLARGHSSPSEPKNR